MKEKELTAELTNLYKKWPIVRKFLKSIGCNGATAEDIFQEALLIYVRKHESTDFTLNVEPIFYVRNTCKFLWYNQSRKDARLPESELSGSEEDIIADDWMKKELLFKRMEKTIQNLGAQCQRLLQEFYGLGRSMVEIAKSIGLRNEKVAKAQKYRCLQKAKELIQQEHDSVELEIFQL